MIKSTAITGQIWEFVNPSMVISNLPPLIEPTWLEPNNLTCTQEEIDLRILSTTHKKELSEKYSLYKIQLNRYN